MKTLYELPVAVQDIAASLLANAIERNWNQTSEKTPKEAAKEINEAILALYEPDTNQKQD